MSTLLAQLSNDALVYEAVQRVYRNALVAYLRAHLLEGRSPSELDSAVKSLFQKEWSSIELSAEQAHATGVTERSPSDALDHLSVNHFRTLVEKFWDEVAPQSVKATPEFANKVRKQMLVNIDDVVSLRNPVSHPPEEPLPVLDGIRCVDAARRVLNLLDLTDAGASLQPLLDELVSRAATGEAAASSGQEKLQANLPPRESVVVDFVGRSAELQDLWSWLLDEHSRRWMLVGDGGKGKSATAYRFARDVRDAAPQPLAVVQWLSAKRRRYEDGEIVSIENPDFTDLGSAIDVLLRGYGWLELADESIEVRKSALIDLLDEFPALIVLDDLDTLPPESDDVSEFFLLDVCATRSKVLVTSRRTYTGMGRSKTVIGGLGEEDATEFVRSRQQLMGLGDLNLSDDRLQRLFEATERSPLYMEDLLRLAKFYSIDQAIGVWKSNQGDKAREYALKREIELLSVPARSVLEVCAVAPSAATVDELARCTGIGMEDVQNAISELHSMYLVPGPQIVEDVPRYQLNRNVGHLIRRLLQETPRHAVVQNAVQAVFRELARPSGSTTIADTCRQAKVFMRGGEVERARQLIERALEQHPNKPELYAMRASIALQGPRGSLAVAREDFQRAHQLRSKDSSMYQEWARQELGREEWKLAAEAAEGGLVETRPDDPKLLRLAGYARSRLARQLRDNFAVERAKQEARASDQLLSRGVKEARRGNVPPWEVSKTYRAWVINADLLGSLDALPKSVPSLCERLEQWLRQYPDEGWAKKEAEYYRDRCPDLAPLLERLAPRS